MEDSDSIKHLTLEWTKAQPAVGRFIRSFVRDKSDAEDVLQEVALTIVDKYEKYDPSRPFIGWALGVAKNIIKAHFRKQLRRPQTVEDEQAIERVADSFEALQPGLEDMKEALQDCMSRVPAEDRKLIGLRYEEELKPAELAGRLGKSANHVAVVLHRIRAALRKCVERKMSATASPS